MTPNVPPVRFARTGNPNPGRPGWDTVAALAVALALGLMAAGWPAPTRAIETTAREAILIDMSTGSVLLERNPDDTMPTASMSKIMTVYMVFEALEQGRLSLDDMLPVSEYAWRKSGSKMFVEVNTTVRVEDLIRGIVVQSGNDASIVVAEALGGTEEEFARQMTERARELGMTNSSFRNSTGWPDPGHFSTARDLAILAQRIISDFPQYYHYFAELEFTFSDIKQGNRNPLLYRDFGGDGLKTGHTDEAGYGLTGSAQRDGRRLVLVLNGLESVTVRAEESARLISWGFREFENYELFAADETVEAVEVWMGVEDTVPLVLAEDLAVTLRRAVRNDLEVTVRVDEPVAAQIAAGQALGTLVVTAPDTPPRTVPLLAGADIERRGFFGRAVVAAGHLIQSALN